MSNRKEEISEENYRALAEFRYQLRRFVRFSEQAARAEGVEPRQHQLLLAIKGFNGGQATIGELAERLQLEHHSVVELVNRAEARGLVERLRSAADRRRVFVYLTSQGEQALRRLSIPLRDELRSTAPALVAALNAILGGEMPSRSDE